MSNIIIYGDSYSEDGGYWSQYSWSKILSFKGYNITNFAIGGSSAEYAFLKFINDANSGLFQKNDVIIFQPSFVGRLHFLHQFSNPPSAWVYKLEYFDSKLIDDNNKSWHRENAEFLKFYIKNVNYDLIEANHFAYLNTLKTFSENNKDNLVIILPTEKKFGFNNIDLSNTDNFLIADMCFQTISGQEVINNERTSRDLRHNHLTKVNLNTLATLIDYVIRTKNIKLLNNDMFKKNIYKWPTTITEAKERIAEGLLDNNYDEKKLIEYFKLL